MTDLLPPYHKPMTSELDCDLANDRVAALEAELAQEKAEVKCLRYYKSRYDKMRPERDAAMAANKVANALLKQAEAEATEAWQKCREHEAEVAIRDRMLRDIIERIALTPERWNGWTTEEVLTDLRARAEKEATDAT